MGAETWGEVLDALPSPGAPVDRRQRCRDANRAARVWWSQESDEAAGPTLTHDTPHDRERQRDGSPVPVTDTTRQAQAGAASAAVPRPVAVPEAGHRAAAGHTDVVLDDLFAVGLHLERQRRLPEGAGKGVEHAIDSLPDTIALLRVGLDQLIDRDRDDAPVGA